MRFTALPIYWALVGAAAVALAGACVSPELSTEDQVGVSATELTLSLGGQTNVSTDGPFATTQALVDYWTSTSTAGARTEIYVNGRNVYERSGAGPAFVKQYFNCSAQIFAVCPGQFPHDGYTNFNTLVSRYPTTAAIYKSGALFRAGTDNTEVDILTCSGDPSFYGAVQYYKVMNYINGFIPYLNGSCYP